jgi:all-trans-retinol 13,14-reductase
MATQPTAVVIGAGMSGLVSAVLMAMHGWKVEVFEQHHKAGGLLHRFSRGGVPYETGFHYCGSIHRDQILGRCLAHLGVLDRIDWVPLDPDGFDRIILPELEFRVPVGVEAYRARLKETFPHQSAGIDGYMADLLEAIRHYGLYRFEDSIDTEQFIRWEGATLDDVIARHVSDPQLRAILAAQSSLYGVHTHEAPFGLHAVIMHHFLAGAYRARGGGDALTGALVARLQELGGELHLRAEVTQLLVDDKRRVQGVQLASGERVDASLVFSSLHPRLLFDLIEPGVVRKAYRSRILDQRLGLSHFGVYAELDRPATEIGQANIYRMSSNDPACILRDIRPGHVPFYFAAAPPPFQRRDGSHAHTLLLSAALSWDELTPWAHTRIGARPAAYHAMKSELEQTVLEAFLDDFPGLRGHVVRSEASTALSTWHYTRSPQGAMYGHYHSVAQMGRYRLPQIIRIHNFVQVGQGVFTPGILGTTLSAYYGCGYHLGLARLVRELEAT